jgi:hypothetical protein
MAFETTIERMIAEQGESWLASGADRTFEYQSVVITDNPSRCWRLTHGPVGWAIAESVPTLDELANFFAAFGAHWRLLVDAQVMCGTTNGPKPYRVCAFIKNGRKQTQEWSTSIEAVEVPAE